MLRVGPQLATVVLTLTLSGLAAPAQEAPATTDTPVDAAPPALESLLRAHDFTTRDIARIRTGAIVSRAAREAESSDETLAVVLGFRLPVGLSRAVLSIAGPALFEADAQFVRLQEIPASATGDELDAVMADIGFDEDQLPELRKLLAERPRADSNLGRVERRRLRDAAGAGEGETAESREAANARFRTLLTERFESYRESGPDGIRPYERRNGFAMPGEALTLATERSPLLAAHLPELQGIAGDTPGARAPGLRDRYFWVERSIRNRPIYSLFHWRVAEQDDRALLVEREFYVSGGYDASQVEVAIFRRDRGVEVFYRNRAFTERVGGATRFVAQRIGRSRMTKTLEDQIEGLREALAATP